MAATINPENINDLMTDLYNNPAKKGGLGGKKKFISSLPRSSLKDQAEEWLRGHEAYSLHKPVITKFKRRPTIVSGLGEQIQADLMDVRSHRLENDNITFLLTCIDVFSKKAWVFPLKNKAGKSVAEALAYLFLHNKFRYLQTDKGKEFYNSEVRQILLDAKVHLFSTENETIKSSMVERFNRTLRGKIHRYLTAINGKRYIDHLDDFVNAYNNTIHSTIGVTPNSVSFDNQEEIWREMYDNSSKHDMHYSPGKKSVKRGDHVRISKHRSTFERGYTPNWSREVFIVTNVNTSVRPNVVSLSDLNNEPVLGQFYLDEVQRVTLPSSFNIEKIVKSRKRQGVKQFLVKWSGYPESFNSWISETDLV